jgi:outer membrane protein W
MRLERAWISVLVAGFFVAMAPAVRAESANNIFRVGAAWVDPDGEADVGGVHLDADTAIGYFADYERRLIPWLGIDLQVGYAKPDITATPIGGGTTASQGEALWTGSAGVNFHLLARSRVDLYLGAYANYTDFDTFDSAGGYGGVFGLDIGLTKSGLALTISARYSIIEADLKSAPGTSVSFDPLVGQVGLGWRF